MKTFTKWFVINAIIFTAGFGAFKHGIIQSMIAADPTFAVVLCLGLYVMFSLLLGKISYFVDKNPSETEKITHKLQPVYFMADSFLYIGLALTTTGLFLTIMNALPLARGGNTEEFIKQLISGVGATLTSTISALFCTILLSVQLFIVSRNLKS